MYHVLKKDADGYEHFLLPWDTDMSFGTGWVTNVGLCYDYKTAMNAFSVRMETPAAKKAHPEYDALASARWKLLRKTILSESFVYSEIDALCETLSESASLQRDLTLWGNRYAGADSIENMKQFIHDRIAVMDSYYCN